MKHRSVRRPARGPASSPYPSSVDLAREVARIRDFIEQIVPAPLQGEIDELLSEVLIALVESQAGGQRTEALAPLPLWEITTLCGVTIAKRLHPNTEDALANAELMPPAELDRYPAPSAAAEKQFARRRQLRARAILRHIDRADLIVLAEEHASADERSASPVHQDRLEGAKSRALTTLRALGLTNLRQLR